MNTHTKIIATSLSLVASINAMAGIGGVNVQSNLGEPFSGSIVVTGQEAQALIKKGSVNVSGNNIHGTVVSQGKDKAVVQLYSASVVNDPVLNFTVKAGNQTRQYTTMVNPANYRPARAANTTHRVNPVAAQIQPNVVQPHDNAVAEPVAESKATHTHHAHAPHMPAGAHPRYYRVRPGESASSIAARYRPHNMSVQRALRALIAANPRAFQNGNPNTMYRNVTLYIPTAAQWHAYANGGKLRAHRPQLAQSQVMGGATESSNTAPVDNVAPAAPALPSVPTTPVAETPQKTEPIAVSESENASASETESSAVSSVQAASDNFTASAASESAASVVSEAPVEEVSETQAQPEPTPVAQPEETPAEEENDWLMMGLMGLVGVGVVGGGIGYALHRRRKSSQEDDELDDDDDDGNDGVSLAKESSVAKHDESLETWTPPADLTEHTSDDIYSAQTSGPVSLAKEENLLDLPTEAEATDSTDALDEFNLTDFEPIPVAETSASTPTESSDLEDWDWSPETETTQAATAPAVAEETDWQFDDFAASDTPAQPVPTMDMASDWLSDETSVVANKKATPTASDEDVLDLDWSSAEPNAVQAGSDMDAVDIELAGDLEKFETSISEPSTPDIPKADANAQSASLKEVGFTNDESLDFSVDLASEEESSVAVNNAVDGFDIDLNTTQPETVIPASESEVVSLADFGEPASATSGAVDFDLDDLTLDTPVESTPATQTSVDELSAVEFESLNSLSELNFDNESEPEVSTESEPVIAPQAAPESVESHDEFGQWDTDNTPEKNDVGFVTESVGMTAPLEAKLELAKMYLEIDDAVAARQTLRELVHEASGDVQAQARQLLEELGN